MNIKRKFITAMTAFAIIVGSLFGGVAFAAPAGAAEARNCQTVDAGPGRTLGSTGYRYGRICYVNYDWFEEVFLGYRDGPVFQWFGNDRAVGERLFP